MGMRLLQNIATYRMWVITAVFLLFYFATLHTITHTSPTFDEHGFITRGVGYASGENRHMRVGHPAGLNALQGIFLASDPTIKLPTDDPSWALTSFHRPSERFMWEIGNDVERILLLARLPMVWIGMLLLALVGRWTAALTRSKLLGLFALIFLALDPNIIANSSVAATDLGMAAATAIAGFGLWRYFHKPTWQNVVLAGMGFALLQNTKFTAGLYVPLFGLAILLVAGVYWKRNGRFPTFMLPHFILIYPIASLLTLWAMYGFDIGTLPDNLPTMPQLSGTTLPLAHHLEQLLDIGGRAQKGTSSFLLGDYRDDGWWYYFPIVFLLKTPLPTLSLFILGLFSAIKFRHLSRINHIGLLVPPLGFLAIGMTTSVNLGYRHLLSMLPFLIVWAISAVSPLLKKTPTLIAILIGWLLIANLWVSPHYLSYFNLLAGGADNGWKALVDSNIDWGQDLVNLKTWMDDSGIDHVYLSYFGESRPDYYNINYTGLDSVPPRLMNPLAQPFYPNKPLSGYYAISATNLQGVLFDNHDQFAYFREQTPIHKIGYSIFIYHVPKQGLITNLVLQNKQLHDIPTETYEQFDSYDIRPRWVTSDRAMIYPQGEFWAFSNDGLEQLSQQSITSGLAMSMADFSYESAVLTLKRAPAAIDDTTVHLTSYWEKTADAPLPESAAMPALNIFIHIEDETSNLVAQWDGFDVIWQGFEVGDVLTHEHKIDISSLQNGTYTLHIGAYDPNTNQRWQTQSGDRQSLGHFEIVR